MGSPSVQSVQSERFERSEQFQTPSHSRFPLFLLVQRRHTLDPVSTSFKLFPCPWRDHRQAAQGKHKLTLSGAIDDILKLRLGALDRHAALDGGEHGSLLATLAGKVETITPNGGRVLEIAWLRAGGDSGQGDTDAVGGPNEPGEEQDGAAYELESYRDLHLA